MSNSAPASASTGSREVRLVSRPVGWPTHDDFELVETEVPALADGQIRVRNLVMSVDPYMRGRMSDAKSYAAPLRSARPWTAVRSASSRSHAPRGSRSATTSCTAWAGASSPSLDAPAARLVDDLGGAGLGLPRACSA